MAVRVRELDRDRVDTQEEEAGDADGDAGERVDRRVARAQPREHEGEDRQVARREDAHEVHVHEGHGLAEPVVGHGEARPQPQYGLDLCGNQPVRRVHPTILH